MSAPSAGNPRLDADLLGAVLQVSPDAAIAVGPDGVILAANALAAELFGYPPGGLDGSPVDSLLPDRLRAGHARQRAGFAGQPRPRRMGDGLDLSARRRDGSELPVDISLAPVDGPQGTVVIAAIRDLTERRQEQADQAQLAAIVDSTDDAVIATTVDGTITSWNPGATRLLGYDAAEVIGRPVARLVPDHLHDELEARRRRVMAGERLGPQETVRRHRDGTDVDVELTLSAVRDKAGQVLGAAAVIRDIRDRVRARADRALAEQRREELATLVDRERIARDLHDLVIQRIFGAGMAVQATATRLQDRADEAARLVTVVEELDATIADIRSTIFDLEQGHAPADSVRARVIELAAELAAPLGFDPVVVFDGPIDAAATPDSSEAVLAGVREALSNVARHARATAARIEVHAGDELVVRVSDNGVGIGTASEGSGLRNVRLGAEHLGGSLTVDGLPGGGTELLWRIPSARDAHARRLGGGSGI